MKVLKIPNKIFRKVKNAKIFYRYPGVVHDTRLYDCTIGLRSRSRSRTWFNGLSVVVNVISFWLIVFGFWLLRGRENP